MAAEGPGEQAPREPTRRLFFALWPDEAMREALLHATRKAARASGGRPVPAANLHVTLAFLGAVPERRLGELAAAAQAAAAPALAVASANAPGRLQGSPGKSDSPVSHLELAFDHLEHWRPAQLLCALPRQPPPPVVDLARRLQHRLVACGFAPDLKPFRPHVTVVRKVSRPGLIEQMHAVVWSFTELVLVASRTLPQGPLYSVVESFLLWSGKNAANNSETP